MKKVLFLMVLFIVSGTLLGACGPDPQDVQAVCEEQYYWNLENGLPNLPRGFIGACVAWYQTGGKTSALAAVCGDPDVWEAIEMDTGFPISSRQECLAFIKGYIPEE